MNKEKGLEIIKERVSEFDRNKEVLTKRGHGETNIRSNYIDIMFKALGWNMKSHYEVVREFSQKDRTKEANTKKVDYAFKLNGKLKFFIEAKEASIDLEHNKDAIYQAKRYAYSSNGKAPIVILTDFEEFRIFNVIKAPDKNNTDRELLKSHSMRYTDYIEKWDLLWDTFSKEAVGNGSLDLLRGKITKNTKTMDADFLEQITNWRELLARNIAIRNEELNVDEINEAVQRILDRFIFIRNLEDREIEPENTLLNISKNKENIVKALEPLFNSLNKTYNGLLFKPHFSEKIKIDDKTIKNIIRQMCYPVSPFQFDIIEPEILGRIYEKFLGSKIRLTENHRVKIEEKPEVRKAGGVYYTPEYIVNYIVKNTVGKKIEGLTPEEIELIKIVDPACGSGSFLIGAYNYILNYHQKWYIKNQKDKNYKQDWYKSKNGEITVTLNKRGDILQKNIFGVDIDSEATEVSIMSLYLKMLDDGFDKGERDLFFIKGAILPDMSDNVKCGNSLIGNDLFNGLLDFSNYNYKLIKPFEWKEEYKNIFQSGGFDCVLGNPPYVDVKILSEENKNILIDKYNSASKRFDLYIPFIERSELIAKQSGIVSFIMPTMFLIRDYGVGIRKVINDYFSFEEIIHFGTNQIFHNAMNYVGIFTFTKKKKEKSKILKFLDCDFTENEIDFLINRKSKSNKKYIEFETFTTDFNDKEWHLLSSIEKRLFRIFESHRPLSEYLEFASEGIHSGKDEVFFIKNCTFTDTIVFPLAKGKDVHRYEDIDNKQFVHSVIYPYNLKNGKVVNEIELKGKYKKVYQYLVDSRKKLAGRSYFEKSSKIWYELWCQRKPEIYTKPKIIGPEITNTGNFTLSRKTLFINNKLKSLVFKKSMNEDIEYILGLLNSKFLVYLHRLIAPPKGNNYFEVKTAIIGKLPIKSIDFKNNEQKESHDKISSLVLKILQLNNEVINLKSDSEKMLIDKQIAILENNIDKEVYWLYGIGEEERKFIG